MDKSESFFLEYPLQSPRHFGATHPDHCVIISSHLPKSAEKDYFLFCSVLILWVSLTTLQRCVASLKQSETTQLMCYFSSAGTEGVSGFGNLCVK